MNRNIAICIPLNQSFFVNEISIIDFTDIEHEVISYKI